MAQTLKALVLDYGGVLVRPQPEASVMRMASRAGVPKEEFERAYWMHRRAYDLDGRAPSYWRRVLESCGAHVPPPALDALVADLVKEDVASWTHYREEVWDLARGFREGGGRTAVLSNGNLEIMGRARAERPFERVFDAVVLSCELGVVKPDRAIYERCLEEVGVDPGRTLFVDDLRENLVAAQALGLLTLHFDGEAGVKSLRERLG